MDDWDWDDVEEAVAEEWIWQDLESPGDSLEMLELGRPEPAIQ